MRRLTTATLVGLLALGYLAAAPAAEQEAIQRAVDRGVMALKGFRGGTINHDLGLTALSGLALLECGVGPEDPSVQGFIGFVRTGSISSGNTYSIALSILFLDRLGDPADIPLIESLGVRLLAGQNRMGGWSYDCPTVGESEVRRLTNDVTQRNQMVGRIRPPTVSAEKPGDKPSEKSAEKPVRRTIGDLPREIQAQLQQINQRGLRQDTGADNSNTQFATLGLWVVRKYGLPVDTALARVDDRFRRGQNKDGGWGYTTGAGHMDHSTATMTCAGLLGLAVNHGAVAARALDRDAKAQPAQNLLRDQSLRAGLVVLSGLVDHPIANKFKGKGQRPKQGRVDGKSYYFLWSVERLAVALDLNTIGGKDWYTWGAEILVDNQEADGSWSGNYHIADTCFALLFLKRANLAKDLTSALRGRIQDPAEVVLRSGGVGGDSLRVPSNIKSGLETEKTKDPGPRPDAHAKKPTPLQDPNQTKRPAEPARPVNPPQVSASAKLARELVQAEKPQQERALEQLREGKGVMYTEALALAIPQLEDKQLLGKARKALIERLVRLKEQSLGLYLKDEDVEIRRAAAVAAAMKDAKGLVPKLIPLLADREELVQRAAQLALRELTGQNFGKEQQDWQNWWNRQKK